MSLYLPAAKTTAGYWFIVQPNKLQGLLFLTADDQVPFGHWQEWLSQEPEQVVQFGSWHQHPCYLVIYQDQLADERQWHTPRRLLLADDEAAFGHAARASQLALFLQTHRFCGQCGHKMDPVRWEFAMTCQQCQHRVYPRISPCVLVAITRPGQILLARSRHFKPGVYSLIAGFVESGETLEQAAIREVAEEVAVDVTQPQYLGSQPWPFPHSLMTAFVTKYVGGDIRCQEAEIEDAQWFEWQALPELPAAQSLSGQIIRALQRDELTGKEK